MATFTKNQAVTLLQNWDRQGTVRIVDLTVYSCGAKQMVLVDAAGEKFEGRFFYPQKEQTQMSRVVPRLSLEAAQAAALALGAEVVVAERAFHEGRIAQSGKSEADGYTKAMRCGIAALHEPRALRAG